MIFPRWAFPLGRFDKLLGEQGHNRAKHLLAVGLGAQDAAHLLHLAAFLSAAMTRSRDEMALHLLPGRPCSITGKEIELRPQLRDHLVDRRDRGVEKPERHSLHRI